MMYPAIQTSTLASAVPLCHIVASFRVGHVERITGRRRGWAGLASWTGGTRVNRMTLLEIILGLKSRRANGEPCDDLMQELAKQSAKFEAMLRRTAKGILVDEEEILNTARTRIWAGSVRFRGGSEGEAYNFCRRIVGNEFINYTRHIQRTLGFLAYRGGVTAPLADDADAPESEKPGDPSAVTDAAVESAAAKEDHSRIELALEQLPQREREIVRLNVANDRPIADIARQTGETADALSKRKERALMKLRTILPSYMAQGRTLKKTRVGRGTKVRSDTAGTTAKKGAGPARKRRTARSKPRRPGGSGT